MTNEAKAAIQAQGLGKRYGSLQAVKDLHLHIPQGQFYGLLGPNGSGKTTTIHMLTTLARPTAGWARVAGFEVTAQPVAVRQAIGLVFQESALDPNMTVEENLRFAAALYNLPPALARQYINELLTLFSLQERRRQPLKALSGGMRRALDIARGVLHRPQILFLDEPTLGLDIPNRRAIWRFIEQLRHREGMTVVLTTHYLEEAEACDQVDFLKHGDLIPGGAPEQLTARLGDYILELEGEQMEAVENCLKGRLGSALWEPGRLTFRVTEPRFAFASLQEELSGRVSAMRWRRPNLNDVFLWTLADKREN